MFLNLLPQKDTGSVTPQTGREELALNVFSKAIGLKPALEVLKNFSILRTKTRRQMTQFLSKSGED